MKKYASIITAVLFVLLALQARSQTCCPKFTLSADFQPCDTTCNKPDPHHGGGNPGGGTAQEMMIVACKNSAHIYRVIPNLPGFTYTWTVTGGTPTSFSGNPITITWGNTTQGTITVYVSDASGNCRDTIRKKICLVDGPTASFTFAPNPVCLAPSTVQFTNTSVGGGVYYWDFGDGTSSTLQHPSHAYAAPGNYTVTLTVSNASGGGAQPERDCGCTDTASAVITVSNLQGINIYTDDCRKMLCNGDTVKYCTNTAGCSGLTWVVNGGTILNGQGTTCITVAWNQPSTYPTTVTLNASCPNTCGNTATIFVPILYPNLPIQGPGIVCTGSTTTYSLPALPGTFYKWTLSGGGNIIGPDSNINFINVNWTAASGTFTITCKYKNPYSGCNGTSTFPVTVKPKFLINGPSQACVGNTSLIGVVGGGSANWNIVPTIGYTPGGSPAGTFLSLSSLSLTWNAPGAYNINAVPTIPANYCTPAASINIVVNDTPAINNIIGPAVVCPNTTASYSISSNMNAGQYNWSVTGGSIIQTMGAHGDSVLVNWTGSGSISVFQIVKGCPSRIVTLNVTVIPAPPAPTGPTTVCMDDTTQYTIAGPTPPGGYTWTLSNPLGSILSGQGTNTISVVWSGGATPGTYTCQISASACGNIGPALTVNVITPPAHTISQSGTLCTTGITLSVSPAMSCYQWYKNGVPISGANSSTYLVTSWGYYSVKCPTACDGKAGIFIPREFIPNVNITADNFLTYCTGDPINVNLIAASHPGCSFQWYRNNVMIGPNAGTLNVTTTGSYFLVITCGNCKDTSNTLVVKAVPCNPGPGCDFSYLPKEEKKDLSYGGPVDMNGNSNVNLLPSTITINPPTNLCNNPQFSATYYIDPPKTFNAGVFWDYGDGNTFSTTPNNGLTPPHQYNQAGLYIVSAWVDVNCPIPPPTKVCTMLDTMHYLVPVAAYFDYSVNCDKILLTDLSSVINTCSITGYAWSVTSGPGGSSFNNPAIPSPVLTVVSSGTYNVRLIVSSNCNGCKDTFNLAIPVTLPSATFTPPVPICAGTPVQFTAPGAATSSYNWNFGDTYQSNLQTTTHTFTGTPPNPTITLTVTDNMGCVATSSQTVNILPPLTVTITPDSFICPGSSITLTTTPNTFTTYQWYKDGVPTVTTPTYTTSLVGEYWVVVSNGPGCSVTSAHMHVWHHPLPIANIQGQVVQCSANTPGNINLQNSVNDPNCSYSWSATGPGSVTYSPNNLQYYASASVTAFGNYQFILTVTNNITGCVARDTFCMYLYQSPTVTVSGPTGNLCAGTNYTFTASATPPNPNYVYQWSNGVTGPVMTTSQAGMYFVTVLNPVSGCTGSAYAGWIKKRPYVDLFPIGCDTLCDTVKLIPPLPLGPGQTYGSQYNIKWYVDGNYFPPDGPVLNLGLLPLGQHQIYVVVTDLLTGCSSTSGIYNVFIKHCGDCDCKGSTWGEIKITEGEAQPVGDNNAKANIPNPSGGTPVIGNPVIGNPIIVTCGKLLKLDCYKTYTINGSYNCKDSLCPGKVTYKLQPPTGSPITGTNPFTFTTSMTGTYILTIYGWCGDKICDSCIVDIVVDCKKCDCKNSKWGEKTYTIDNVTKPISCMKPGDKPIDVKCKTTVSINAGYFCADSICNKAVTYSLVQPSGTSTGNLPTSFILNQTGTYTLTMYAWCGTTKCDSCVISFKTVCDSVSDPCCPYNITVKDPTVQLSTLASPPATIANANFGISGPSGNLFTEIRAEVMSYNLFSNFNNECLSCKSYPYSWASIYQAGTIGAIPPKITMYNSTVPSFNPSGNGMYQNPREVVWTGNPPFALPNNINIQFLLPPASIIDCCELTAKICVKFTFRDKDCKECEVISCFTVVIKPSGGHDDPVACKCQISPVLSFEGNNGLAVNCGGTANLFLGNIPVNLNPGFTCKDPNGKDCEGSSLTVTIKRPDNSTQTLSGPGYSYTYLAMTGIYEYTITGNCGGNKCECKFKVNIPK